MTPGTIDLMTEEEQFTPTVSLLLSRASLENLRLEADLDSHQTDRQTDRQGRFCDQRRSKWQKGDRERRREEPRCQGLTINLPADVQNTTRSSAQEARRADQLAPLPRGWCDRRRRTGDTERRGPKGGRAVFIKFHLITRCSVLKCWAQS